jgi:hypothetical protein
MLLDGKTTGGLKDGCFVSELAAKSERSTRTWKKINLNYFVTEIVRTKFKSWLAASCFSAFS